MENKALVMFKKTIQKSNEDRIFIKPLCDFFEIDSENQVVNIKNDHILAKSYGKDRNKMMFGDNYPRVFLTKKGFVRWVQLISPKMIALHLRQKFEQYQELLFDFMFGSVEHESKMHKDINRIHKLERLYSKIGIEIKRIKTDINLYLSEKYLQTTIQWNQQKPINKK